MYGNGLPSFVGVNDSESGEIVFVAVYGDLLPLMMEISDAPPSTVLYPARVALAPDTKAP